jgi:carbonic anhydrase/acetyltransferase-like protein (isoleucine patch superfamily)
MKKYEFVPEDVVTLMGVKLTRIRALRDNVVHRVKAGDLGGYIGNEDCLSQENDAWVGDNAYVYPDARVVDNAVVRGTATISDSAVISGYATVSGQAQVYGHAQISDHSAVLRQATVCDNARVSGHAIVIGTARVQGNASVSEGASVLHSAFVSGEACISGDAIVKGVSTVEGKALVSRRSDIFSATGVGTQNGTLTVYKTTEGIGVTRGCFSGTVDEFLTKSKAEHSDVIHREYQMLIEVAKSRLIGSNQEGGAA